MGLSFVDMVRGGTESWREKSAQQLVLPQWQQSDSDY
jgi:hypothetical protein